MLARFSQQSTTFSSISRFIVELKTHKDRTHVIDHTRNSPLG